MLPQLARVVVLRQLSGGAEEGEGTLSSGLWGDAGGFGVAGSRGDAGPPVIIKVVAVERRKQAPQGSRVSRPVVVERRAQVEQQEREEEGAVHVVLCTGVMCWSHSTSGSRVSRQRYRKGEGRGVRFEGRLKAGREK